ncbi:MAG: AI-2E family transporter [Bacteroidetes bacterium]|nr:MAG: AI-2E family transporter [Bacteroidota bacterium]
MADRFPRLEGAGCIPTLVVLGVLGYFTRSFFAPLIFAGVFTLMLHRLCAQLEKWVGRKGLAAVLAMSVAGLPVLGVLTLLSIQSARTFQTLPNLPDKLYEGLEKALTPLLSRLGLDFETLFASLGRNIGQLISTPLELFSQGISASTAALTGLFLCLLFTFFFLLHRRGLYQLLLLQFSEKRRPGVREVCRGIQHISERYLAGLGLVVVVLSGMNALGLWLIGIPEALFWGLVAGVLAIVPFVGTILGGALVFLFALAASSTWWQPPAVIVLFAVIQFLEGNFITPRILGQTIRLNAMSSILALVAGGAYWGLPGLLLALPLTAMLRLLFLQIPPLEPLGRMLGVGIDSEEWLSTFDRDEYRLTSLFR